MFPKKIVERSLSHVDHFVRILADDSSILFLTPQMGINRNRARMDASPVVCLHDTERTMTIQNQKAGESLLRERSVLAKVGLSRAYWWKLVAAGTAPRPIKIGRASLWIASEIDAFIQTRIAESRAPNAA